MEPSSADLEEINRQFWYHTIELPGGHVTPGKYDHRKYLKYYGFPADLVGKSVLDAGTGNGFFAFEFERRGAARIVAIDLDPPTGARACRWPGTLDELHGGFALAHRLLDSSVEFHFKDACELSVEEFGKFDLVLCADVLVHVSDPIRLLEAVRSVTAGTAVIVTDCWPDPLLRLYERLIRIPLRILGRRLKPTLACLSGDDSDAYWIPTIAGVLAIVRRAGFKEASVFSRFRFVHSYGSRWLPNHVVIHAKP